MGGCIEPTLMTEGPLIFFSTNRVANAAPTAGQAEGLRDYCISPGPAQCQVVPRPERDIGGSSVAELSLNPGRGRMGC